MELSQIPLNYTAEKWHKRDYRYNTFWYLLLEMFWFVVVFFLLVWLKNQELGLSSENIYAILIFNLWCIIYSASLILSNSVSSLLIDLEIPNKICCIT